MDPILKEAYSPETFREQAHRVVDILADHLQSTLDGNNEKTIPWIPPEDSNRRWQKLGEEGASVEQFCRDVLSNCIRIHDPRYMGHQISAAAPTAAIAGLVTDFIGNGTGVYEMGMAGTAMENFVVATVARKFRMDNKASGFLTSGGTLANLTALLAARSIKSKNNDWTDGTSGKLAIMVSDQSHYSVDRAARIMGWGEGGIIKVPTNDRFQMRTELLPDLLQQAEKGGRTVLAVVGSACSTVTGSFDDLQAISGFCQQHGLWFHVDGAHGAAVAFSKKHSHLVNGIEGADSVIIDFHKMLMAPAIASAVIFRRGEESFRTFALEADYIFAKRDELDWHNLARRTFECTKTMMGMKIFSLLAVHGTELLEANVDRLQETTRKFAELIRDREDFALAVEPQTNIVCYRYTGPRENAEGQSDINASIREAIVREGKFYIVQTSLNGQTWLRSTITNPFTTDFELSALLDEIELMASSVACN